MKLLAHALEQFELAEPRTFANLSVIPLLHHGAAPPAYLTLDEALATGGFHITEVSDAGQVPELRVRNDLDRPVMLLDGEELVGAKQNRVVNLTILVGAQSTVTIPVSCVEAGRWAHESLAFRASDQAQFLEGRASKLAQVSRSLAQCQRAEADQHDVWNRIEMKARQLGSRSRTGAMRDIFDQHRHSVEEFVCALAPVPDQVGAALAINGRLAGVEFFDAAHTLGRLLPKIVSSYALDAVTTPRPRIVPAFEAAAVRTWLGALADRPPRAHATVGLGETLRWDGPGATAAALAVDGALVHFVAFPAPESNGSGGGPRMRSASSRRRQQQA
jgi:hypothetical protein